MGKKDASKTTNNIRKSGGTVTQAARKRSHQFKLKRRKQEGNADITIKKNSTTKKTRKWEKIYIKMQAPIPKKRGKQVFQWPKRFLALEPWGLTWVSELHASGG